MNKIVLFLLVLFYSITTVPTSCHAAVNLAKGKTYAVLPSQNYPLSAPPVDKTALTDGSYSVGHFWTQKTTVGWQRVNTVEILIDLEKEADIGSIVFSSARGKDAEVYYPRHVLAFVGSNRNHLIYVGDLTEDPENQPGSYQTRRFKLDKVGILGRYLLLEVIPNGAFLFCDEIEVVEGKGAQRKPGGHTVETAREFAEQLLLQPREKERLNKMAATLASMVKKQAGETLLRRIKQQILELRTASNANAIETELLALRGTELAKQIHSKSVHVQSINPWIPLSPVSPLTGTASSSISLVMPLGGYDSGAALITNLSARLMPITVELESVPETFDLFLYHVPFVATAAKESVADPLVPVTGAIHLRAGESRMVFISAMGKHSGNWSTALRIKSDSSVAKLPLTVQVANIALPEKLSLNAVNWAYLDFNLIRNRQQVAVSDLLAHHTNVVVVPPAYLPNADPVKSLDFSRLESYLRLHKGVDKALLFMNLKTDNRLMLGSGYSFLGEQWKAGIKRWFDGAWQAAERAGFKSDHVYWYPFDEMKDNEIAQFIDIAKWARREIPGIRFYATLENLDSERALPYLDIAQIVDIESELGKFSGGDAEIWLYDGKSPAKSSSPYSFYRLMAWKAFLNDYKGVGFWAYADAGWGDSGTAWDDFDGAYPDYAVVYEGPGTSIVSSRRWEGWRMGIEDYELLTMYAKSKGGGAKALAKLVLDNPEDTSKADEVRRNILKELTDKLDEPGRMDFGNSPFGRTQK